VVRREHVRQGEGLPTEMVPDRLPGHRIARADELRMQAGVSYEKALKHARRRGISYVQAVDELVS
jgi:hypothetical protein